MAGRKGAMRTLLALLLILLVAPALADTPPAFDPVIGTRIDLTTPLTDETGVTRPLGAVMAGKPAVVLWGYDLCPNLCGTAQGALADTLSRTGLKPGDYAALFLTVDPAETPADAKAAHEKLLAADNAAQAEPWHFLGGPSVTALAARFGIGEEQRARIAQFVHPVGAITLTADGRISGVLPGIGFEPNDLRLALVDASEGKLGTLVDHILLLCAGFDTSRGQYTATIFFALQMAAVATLTMLGALLFVLRRREPKA